ncbi:NnrS family protein [Sulfurimonas sp.]|uniref:NnrS family protein n=1 Tax=Sulfurimonas sp. TaxID=2022749 RepID=UPI002AAF65AB|nr:NnrS family protein [Sulfurimonas sp.]
MSEKQQEEKLRATNHYLYYPDEKNVPPYLAYGFRPIFLLLAPYIVISMVLWGLVWSGTLSIPFMQDVLTWHVYEMLYGLITAGVLAFLATGLPELFPGLVPLVGKRLKYVVMLWLAGRVSFWLIDITGIYLTAFLNLAMLGWIIWFAKDAVLDKLQRHASIGYTAVALFIIEVWFFASQAGFVQTTGLDILKVALGAIVVIVLLALRRVNMEAINELMEDKGIDDVFISRPPKTNLAIFMVIIFTTVEFLYPQNSALAWLGFGAGTAILGITSEYKLKDEFILNQPYVIYLASIYVLFSIGYVLMAWDLLNPDINGINHFRHFITSGGIGLSYIVVMLIISWVHTGRKLTSNIYTHLMVFLIILATFMRGLIPFFDEYTSELYLYSSLIWSLPFVIYMVQFSKFLVNERADGIKG